MKYIFNKTNKRKSSSQSLILLLFVVNVLISNRQIEALKILTSDEINEHVTFKLENSPFVANENLIVGPKGKLTIEPGCEIHFAKGKQLIVYGTLEARGTQLKRIKFTKIGNSRIIEKNTPKFRLVEGETMQDGKLQIFYNSKWNYVCSTQYNWTITDGNVTCKSLGYSNGTFYYYAPTNNFTSHMKVFSPGCSGNESNLFECPGSGNPELGLTVCDHQRVVSLVCEGYDDQESSKYDNWGGIVFQKYAPFIKKSAFMSVFFNISQSILEYVDITHAGLVQNTYRRYGSIPHYGYYPGSAIVVFQYAPTFNNITIEHSLGYGLNYSNIEAPATIMNSAFRFNRGHGIVAKTRFGNVNIFNTVSEDNMGDGLKYYFNNTVWTPQEQEEYFMSRYVEYCDSQNPLSYPAYYRFKNPNYVRECSKTFSTGDNQNNELRITLHFQKVNIVSKYSTYWLEVYDGQTEKNPLIANYTFENGKTPESIFSRSSYMFVKLKFHCNYPTDRTLQPLEIQRLQQKNKWDQIQTQQLLYEEKLYKYNRPQSPELKADRPWQENPDRRIPGPLPLDQLTLQEQKEQWNIFERQQQIQDSKFKQELNQKQHELKQARIFCPYSNYDDITMYAMIGDLKNPDLVIKNSVFSRNSINGINATGLHSLVQINETTIANNQMNGIHVQGGAGDLSLYHCKVESNSMNGINMTYAGGLKEFNFTRIYNNGLYGIFTNYDVTQEFDNIFQNTTLNSSIVEFNMLGGVYLGSYCNHSNITINATIFRNNQEDALVIESCASNDGVDWYMLDELDRPKVDYKRYLNITFPRTRYVHLNISWNLFEANRLNGLKILALQNMIGVITNNTFINHRRGALLITANNSKISDSIIRNVSIQIFYNKFYNNSGRYALNVACNDLSNKWAQSINITFNRFEHNHIFEPYGSQLNPRSTVSGVAIVSSSNIAITQNIFNNPLSKIQIATQLENYTSVINATYNWFSSLTPVYQLDYYLSNRDKCNQQWKTVRSHVFDHSNRSNLAQIVYWPYSCNDRLWYYESSIDLPPPKDFDMSSADTLGGIYDSGDSILPVNRYTVINDIVIKPGASLTLKSGTELNFLNGIGMLVLGELRIDGAFGSTVNFRLANQLLYFRYKRQTNDSQLMIEQIPLNATVSSTNEEILEEDPPSEMLNLSRNLIKNGLRVDLVDGPTSQEGRVRVEMNGKFGTVCNRGWNMINSKIVCQQLGLISDPRLHMYNRWLEKDPREYEPILMSEVQCDSLDLSIFECRHTKHADHTCTHMDDVWIRCVKPGWAGVRMGVHAQPSSLKYAVFESAGQYDFGKAQLAPALQIDLMQHELSNLTFQYNQHTSMEILFNQPFKKSPINNIDFFSNEGAGLVTRTSFLRVNQINATNNLNMYPVVEYNPFFSLQTLESVRIFSSEPRRGFFVRRELTRLLNNEWYIGSEQMVLLYTDTEYNYGPYTLNVQIKTDNNRVIVVDLVDYNTNFEQEQVVFCERFCQQSFADPTTREWNLSLASNSMHFPINTSFSALHINYNVKNLKSGRLTFIVYSVKAPEPTYDYNNPSYIFIRNIMPDNILNIHNSSFYNNRHSIVVRHYDDTEDVFGNLRKRYNYTNIKISNCTFDYNDQLLWINTDPIIPNFHQRSENLTIHVTHSLFDSNKDDSLVAESGYQMFDLIPSIKIGPIGRINVTIEDSIFTNNYGGVRGLYRYQEYSNTLWHYEIRNNKFKDNYQGGFKLRFPRISRYALKHHWENISHTMNIMGNEFNANRLFEINIDGYFAEMNLTKNLFVNNICRIGLVKLSGTEKDFYIYRNHVEGNEANYLFDLEANSHADNDFDYQSLFVDNVLERNRKPNSLSNWKNFNDLDLSVSPMRDAANLLIQNSPSSYGVALRGIQNCSFHRNLFDNGMFDYEFVGGMTTNTLNSTIDATLNWWGTYNATLVKKRIFDIHEWNNHALVNFVPYTANKIDYVLSYARPELNIYLNTADNILGGIIYKDLTLSSTKMPYQVRSDITILPGATLYIAAGVEMEFYPNVGILVLGDLKASGTQTKMIKMRPVKKANNRMPYYSSILSNSRPRSSTSINNNPVSSGKDVNLSKYVRLFSGITAEEGFLQIYNSTLRTWTVVCDRQFTLQSASIVCKQMGFESRNPFVKSLRYYQYEVWSQPIWNQTFICHGGEQNLAECDTFANYHIDQCRKQGEYTYVMCKPFVLDELGYENAWGGIRFAQPYFESYFTQNHFGLPETPVYAKPEFQQIAQDQSYMYFVEVFGAGRLHNVQNPAVQLIHRTPTISFCNIVDSNYHGLEVLQSKTTAIFNKLKITSSLGYGVNSLQLNVQSTDQKSSFSILTKNTLSFENTFGMVDICDPHKHYNLDQRVIIYYKYSNLAKDCVKIFKTKVSSTNIGGLGQIGIRFMQIMLVNNTVQNDTIELYNGTLFNKKNLMTSLTNGSEPEAFERFYLSKTDTLSIFMKASIGREFNGFIAEILVFPTSQYLLTDTYIELSDSEFSNNQMGAVSFVTAGERNPNFYFVRNRLVQNGFEYFNTSTPPAADLILQNIPRFYFGNNFIANNWGGVNLQLHSGSGVLITSSVVYNNLFYANKNDTALCARGGLQLPYNELTIEKNLFIENHTPRTDVILISGLLSKFTRNQLVFNKGARILYTQGFENVSSPRFQDISFNLFRDNFAYGIINELEDQNRFRSTMVAASLKQVYYANYLFNKYNDFELTALPDPISVAFLQSRQSLTTPVPNYWNDFSLNSDYNFDRSLIHKEYVNERNYFDPKLNIDFDPLKQQTTKAPYDWDKLAKLVAYNGAINATFNYWSTNVESEIRARIRDKYDNATLYEIAYSPAVPDEFKLRDGKCELGWSLIDDTCYTYIGSYVNYKEAENVCKKFESRLARETVAPIKLPRFRKLARASQYDYEAQSYRRIWLYTELVNPDAPNSKCNIVEDFGIAESSCVDYLPFICEKDPVFLGAAFRFKDELAFAIAAVGALIVCIILLCCLWLYKSRKRKKEHLDRQNTLRTSARTHRHMIYNNSSVSSSNIINQINKSSQNLYGSSIDNLSSSRFAGSRSLNNGIYNSQRNQYFASKKFKHEKGDSETTKNNEIPENGLNITRTFTGSGLDGNEGSNYYGVKNSETHGSNDENYQIKSIINNSNQYHIYDPNNTNKSSMKYYGEEEIDEEDDTEEDTTTDDLTDDTAITKRQSNRFNIKEHSPGDSSNKTTLTTYTENNFGDELNNKQFIQARLVKTNIDGPSPTKQSTPNLNIVTKNNQRPINPHTFKSSYDQLMNTTLTTDTEDDPDGNSRRLLTNKVNNSHIIVPTTKRKVTNSSFFPQTFNPTELDRSQNNNNNSNISTFTNGSILSKSTLNMTNVTPLNASLTNSSQIINHTQQPSAQFSSSEYENLSNNTLNDILTNYPNHTVSNSNKQTAKSVNNLLQFVKPQSSTTTHQPPNLPPPPVPQIKIGILSNNQNQNTDDSDSVMSSVLITSSNLLLNRNIVRDAKNINTNLPAKFTPKSALKQPGFISNNQQNHRYYDTDSESGMSCQLITSSNLLLNRDIVKDAKQISNKDATSNSNLPQQLTSQYTRKHLQPPTDTDSDSVMSCQLITSSSLLLNRNTVREAQNIIESPSQKRPQPPLNPRHFLTTQPKTNESTTQTQAINNEINQDLDASKPPPMETAI